MAYLITDSGGKPVPQYKNVADTAFEEMRGTNGAIHTAPQSLPSIPAGSNLIGKVSLEPVPNIVKHLSSVTPDTDTALWEPAAGKSILLKGLIMQNLTEEEGSVASGLGAPDASVIIKAGATPISTAKLLGHHVISDTVEKIFFTGGSFGLQTLMFGQGIKLNVDTSLFVHSSLANITITAWGYEVD